MKSRTDWFVDIVFWISVIVVIVMFYAAILTLATKASRKASTGENAP